MILLQATVPVSTSFVPESVVVEGLKILGIALPLVVILIRQLEECRKERIEAQKLFNEMLIKQAESHASIVRNNSESINNMSRNITDATVSIVNLSREIQVERREILDAMHELHDDTLAIFRELKHAS